MKGRIDKDQVISELNLKFFGAKNWMTSEDARCLTCDKNDKFGILFIKDSGVVKCMRCDESNSLFNYLKEIGRSDLVLYERTFSIDKGLHKPNFDDVVEDVELSEVELPKGYTRINYDKYLSDRNFKSYQYDQFEVGITDHFLEARLHNYLIFVFKQNGKRVGWLARSKYSKEWHKENLIQCKLGKAKMKLRYMNSTGTDFQKIVGGFDEITENTHTLIIVEGLFDKTNVSNLLKTKNNEELKVIMTFGDSISPSQINKLKETKVENVIVMYDYNTIKLSKKASLELSKWFKVDVCEIKQKDIDPGNINANYLSEILKKRKNYLYFYNSKLNIVI